jgi:spermidine/putrescine transport system substrate-binding protein
MDQDGKDLTPSRQRELEGLVAEVAHGRINRRQFIYRAAQLGLATTAIASVLAACGGGETTGASASPQAMDTTLPDKLFFYNWSEYMAPEIKASFQKKYGVKVIETYFEDNEALLAKLKSGVKGYDLTVTSDYMVSIMTKTGLLRPLDMKYIPNFKNVMPRMQKPEYDPETDGKKYSVPYQWGATVVGVRTDVISDPVSKWSDLWNPKYKNNIVMLNDERDVLGAALKMMGYSMNTTSQEELDKAVAKCIEQKPLVRTYTSIATQRMIVQGVGLTEGWTGYVVSAYDALGGKNLRQMVPEEGFDLWTDNAVIPVGGPSPYAAHLFINYLLEPKIAGQLVDYTWFYSPVPAARQYSDPVVWKFTLTDEEMKRGEALRDLGEFGRNYAEAWQKVKEA